MPSNVGKTLAADDISSFLEEVCETDPFKVEKDLGFGFVKLRSTEAEKRQAAQDIRSVEDIVIELLRNSRDAGAKNIYVATTKENNERTITIIDDGSGIPQEMWDTIFEPRVTSKLETAHMDKWGMHGRGMALYSTRVNALSAKVALSAPNRGTSLVVTTDSSLTEKRDQSTFPTFENNDGVMSMRGPKNILRTCCEFALEHRRDLNVYYVTPAQIATTLYEFGLATIPAYQRAFTNQNEQPLIKMLGISSSPDDLSNQAAELGLDISTRTARRILDGQIKPLDTLYVLIQQHFFERAQQQSTNSKSTKRSTGAKASSKVQKGDAAHIRLSASDKEHMSKAAKKAFKQLAEAYYLDDSVDPHVSISRNSLVIDIPLINEISSIS